MEKIIFDTDIGDDIDDALALTFAVLEPQIELVGVTTVFKNTEKRADLACCVLEALGETDIPVYVGIGQTVLQSIPDWEQVAEGPSTTTDGDSDSPTAINPAAPYTRR